MGTIGKGMESLYHSDKIEIVSFDVYSSEYISFIADANNIPLHDCTFDAVLIQYVLEHVAQPHTVVSEIERVLKTDGIVYSETRFLEQVHEAAYDFTKFTLSGHPYLFKNFSEIKSGISMGIGMHLLWTIEYFFRGLFRSKFIGKIFNLMFFWLRYFDNLIGDNYNIDMADSFYFIGKKTKNNVFTVQDLPYYYKGADNK